MWKKLTFTLLIGLVCGYFALQGVDFSAVADSLRQVSWRYFVLGTMLMALTHLLRTWRWYLIIKPLHRVDWRLLLPMNCVGFMLVNVLPLRLGEFARPLMLAQRTPVPVTAALATCAVERLFDGLSVLIILMVGLGLAPIPVTTIPLINWKVSSMVTSALLIFLPIFFGLTALIFWQKSTLKLLRFTLTWLRADWRERCLALVEGFLAGLSVLKGCSSLVAVMLASLTIWGVITWITYLQILAFHMPIPWIAAFTVLGIICLGIMLPGPPGFAGNYELFCKAALALYAIDANTAIGFAIATHAQNLGFMVLTGLLALPWTPINLKKLQSFS